MHIDLQGDVRAIATDSTFLLEDGGLITGMVQHVSGNASPASWYWDGGE